MTLLDPSTVAPVRPRRRRGRPRWLFRSLISKLAFLIVVFLTVPIIVYSQFQQADSDKRQLLLDSVREQGRLLAEGLRPTLEREDPSPLLALPDEIVRLVTPHTGVKVLFRPKGAQGAETFFLVAVEPAVPPAELEDERDRLLQRGVLDNLSSTCEGKMPVALRHSRPRGEELLTSITPITTAAGCWAVVTAHSSGAFLGTSIGQPYWQTFEVKIAAESYLIMAAITISILFGIWHSLTRFGRLARRIRTGTEPTASFEAQNRVPELAVVAGEFDRMTQSLRNSADDIRRAAEDNAHAFKTPIAIMRQSLEPLCRIVPEDSTRGQRALEVLETAVDRLDQLVAGARHLDEATAALIDPPRQRIDLSRLTERMLGAYGDSLASRRVRLTAKLEPKVMVQGSEELLEIVIENVIDNALGVSPTGSEITVELTKTDRRARLEVKDEGAGVADGNLDRIFERYVSLRSETKDQSGAPLAPTDISGSHLGIGLWIVRRNLSAVGGRVHAENRDQRGLVVVMDLPLAA
jgi:two-component system sensor histidine kinase ChvG